MKKKVMALVLTTAFVCDLAGCGSGNTTKAPREETGQIQTTSASQAGNNDTKGNTEGARNLVIGRWSNQVRNDRTQEVLDMYAKPNPGITFNSQLVEYSDYWTKLATAAAGNLLSGVLQMDYSFYLKQYVEGGPLEDLTPHVEQGLLDVSEIDEKILDSGTVDGKLYAVCSGVSVPVLAYNKTLTDELGIEIRNNMIIEEFIDVSRETYEKSDVKTDFGYGNVESIMHTMRGEGFSDIFKDGGFDVPGEDVFQPSFDIYETGYKEGWMLDAGIYAELTVNSVEQCPSVYFSSPSIQSWCACYWSNQLTAMQQAVPEGVELEYFTWLAKNPQKANYLRPGMSFSVAPGSSNKEEAVKILNHLINDIDCNSVLPAERGVLAPINVADVIVSLSPGESQKEIKFINEVVTPNSPTMSLCSPVGVAEVFSLMEDMVEKILCDQPTSTEVSSEFHSQGNVVLTKQG